MHALTGLFVYNTTKSKNTITLLNRLGLSISYDDILRIRTGLAAYAKITSQTNVPLPSHFNSESYVTVAVIFQDFNVNTIQSKPKVSSLSINRRNRTFTTTLKCQELKHLKSLSKIINYSSNYTVNDSSIRLTSESYETDLQKGDFAWFLSRMAISKEENTISVQNTEQTTPSWSSFNSIVTTDNRCKQIVGYLPVLPFPVTDPSTVYTCLCNFKDLLSQLKQKYLAIACDEGVYRIARHITLEHENEFDNIILFMGNFHIIKVLLSCIGKYLKHSGVESIFIETSLIGVSVTDQVLSGQNYARSVKGFTFLSEALRRLQLSEFFTNERIKKYENELISIILLKENCETSEVDDCSFLLAELENSCSTLLSDFHSFIETRCKESELFQYWNNFLILTTLMHDLIRADRTGDWKLHMSTIKKLQPIFHIMDRTNYSTWSAVYLEDMLQLESKAPEVYEQFMKGRFTVKKSDVPGNRLVRIKRWSKLLIGLLKILVE